MENTNFLRSQHYSRLSKTATYKALKKTDFRGRFENDIEQAGEFKTPNTKPKDLSATDCELMLNSMNDYRTFIKTRSKPQMTSRGSALSMPRAYHQNAASSNEISCCLSDLRLQNFENFKKMRRTMDRAYIEMTKAYAVNAKHLETGNKSSQGSKRKVKGQRMDKAELLKGDHGALQHHVDTYESISSTFKHLHDQQKFLGGTYGHSDPFTVQHNHRASSVRLQHQSVAVQQKRLQKLTALLNTDSHS